MFGHISHGLRGAMLAAATTAAVLPGTASAASIDMNTFTCAQFENSVPTAQYALLFWLEGHLADEAADGVYHTDLDRTWETIVEACPGRPLTPVLEAIGVLTPAPSA